jgi:hypothetical protein
MIVPLSEAVASIVPSLLNVIHDRGDLWASTTFTASNLTVSNIRTSPVVGGTWVLFGGVCAGGEKEEVFAFCGNG